MDGQGAGQPVVTPSASIAQPFGMTRVRALRLLEVLVKSGNDAVNAQLVESGAVDGLLEMFFTYTENNFVHRGVAGIVSHVVAEALESESEALPTLFVHLFNGEH